MGLIVYSKTIEGTGDRIQSVAELIIPKEEIEIYRSIDQFVDRLLLADCEGLVAVLIATKIEELLQLTSILPVLRKVRIILILPDRKPETINIGYKLEPRFLSYIDSGFFEVQAVLKKMYESMSNSKAIPILS